MSAAGMLDRLSSERLEKARPALESEGWNLELLEPGEIGGQDARGDPEGLRHGGVLPVVVRGHGPSLSTMTIVATAPPSLIDLHSP